MARATLLLLLLAAIITLVSAGAPTFCKCTCFKNSTILPLGPEDGDSTSNDRRIFSDDLFPTKRTASSDCSECTKSFCLGQGIDICEDAKEEDVMTLCFQRDSNKDKIIVWGFILGVLGLLGWTTSKRLLAWRAERAFSRPDVNYAPVSAEGR